MRNRSELYAWRTVLTALVVAAVVMLTAWN